MRYTFNQEPTMANDYVLMEKKDRIARITLNRPKELNALNNALKEELFAAFREFDADPEVDCAILTGAGRAFAAGGDIKEMVQRKGQIGSREYIERQKLAEFIEEMTKPVIAAVNGFAFGGGCELCMACDMRIASSAAKFGQLEVNVGILPIMGGTQRLPRLVGKGMAKYLIFTGNTIDANEALRIGLVEKVVEPDQLLAECEAIAAQIAAKSPAMIALAKAAVNLSAKTDLTTGLIMEGYFAADAFAMPDRTEGMNAFLEKRPPVFQRR